MADPNDAAAVPDSPPPVDSPPTSSSTKGQDNAMGKPAETKSGKKRKIPSSNRKKDPIAQSALSKDLFYNLIKSQSQQKYVENMFDYKYSDVVRVLISVKEIFMEEPPLVRCEHPVIIVGDLHGQYNDLMRVFNHYNKGKEPGYLKNRFVFLGDYVDRGEQSLEVIMMCFMLKCRFPNSYYLLRGNHECKPINRVYGFFTELTERFTKDEANNLFHMFNEAFSFMPLACVIGGTILCCHGGISPKLTSLDEILKIPKPLPDPNVHELATDLMWSDPMFGLKGYRPNKIRGVSVHFGEDALDECLKRLGLKMVVRGHQMMMNGFNFYHNKKLVTIFTAASYYPDKANHGAVMRVNKNGRIGFTILVPEKIKAGGLKVFRGEHDEANDEDMGYIKSNT